MKQLVLSIDLESFLCRDRFSPVDESQRKLKDGGYIVTATREILRLLQEYNQHITFFIVSEIYNWYPELIHEIKSAGHEIGWHTHSHVQVINSQVLATELQRAEKFLQEFRPVGFRAPQLDLYPGALSLLAKYGFKYDSSSYSAIQPQIIDNVWELPVAFKSFRQPAEITFPSKMTLGLLAAGLPTGSGLLLGLMGEQAIKLSPSPYVGILHPWQVISPPLSFGENLSTVVRNPLITPYLINCRRLFIDLLKNYQLVTMAEYLQSVESELT